MSGAAIVELSAEPLDIQLSEPFGIAGGAQTVARNVLVTLCLSDGTVGIGEAAPFPAVSGETQHMALAAATAARAALKGLDVRRWRGCCAAINEVTSHAPSAQAALETALLDAFCRHTASSLWHFFGGRQAELVTDITIPTGSASHASASAARALANGFTTLKVKVGGAPLEKDVERLRAIIESAPAAELVLDANASLGGEEAVSMVRALGRDSKRVILFEQPTARHDLDGMRMVRQQAKIAVAADESAASAEDVARLANAFACDVINVKIMKSGIVGALDMVATAQSLGLRLMIGGMVESKLAMTVSACLAGGLGGFSFVDLDTPQFMPKAPIAGGWLQSGAHIRLDAIRLGHGASFARGP